MRAGATSRLGAIEAGRGVAATFVVFYHVGRHLGKVNPAAAAAHVFLFGHAGVDFFFVISGFIILHVHAGDIGQPGRLRHYLARRFTRVYPTYWVALALTLALGLAGQHHTLPAAADVLTSILLLPSHTPPLLGVAWTMQYEIVFYAAFAVLIINRVAGGVLLLLWLAWIAIGAFGIELTSLPKSLYGIYNLEFFAGMAAAQVPPVRAPRTMVALGIAAFAAAATAEDFGWLDGYRNLGRLAYGLPSVLIVLGAASANWGVPAPLRTLGAASYSIYLFQFIFLGAAWHILSAASLPMFANFCILAACGTAGGILMSQQIEYPLMRRLRQQTLN